MSNATEKWNVRLRSANGVQHVHGQITSDTTLAQLKTIIQGLTSIPPNAQKRMFSLSPYPESTCLCVSVYDVYVRACGGLCLC